MSQTTTAQKPLTTIEQIRELQNHGIAKSFAAGKLMAFNNLPVEGGPMLDKKLFFDEKANRVVYVFNRQNTPDIKYYVIF